MSILIQLLLFCLTNYKAIFQILKTIVEIIRGEKQSVLRQRWIGEAVEAVRVYQRTRDKRPLENLLCRLKGSCET